MDNSKKEFALKWVPIFFTSITVVLTLVNYIFYDRANKELTNAKLQIENELRPREFENNLKLTLYKEKKEAIGQKDTTMQKVTLLVINEMLKEDSVFREKLITILLQSTNSQQLIETQQKLDVFQQEEQIRMKPDKFTIDVFYLEGKLKETEQRADDIYSVLVSKHPTYTIRKRLLPQSINARTGYRIENNQIHYNAKDGLIVSKILNEIQSSGISLLEQYELDTVRSNRENYMSIFVRNK
jgi:hypothetical protein